MAKWSEEAIATAHTQRELDMLVQGPRTYTTDITEEALKAAYIRWSGDTDLQRILPLGKYLHCKFVHQGRNLALFYASKSKAYDEAFKMILGRV